MPFTSGQILRSEEVRAFVYFLTEKFAPDSFKGMRSASIRPQAGEASCSRRLNRSLIAVRRLQTSLDQAQMLEAGVA
jgi:hypothetical protein